MQTPFPSSARLYLVSHSQNDAGAQDKANTLLKTIPACNVVSHEMRIETAGGPYNYYIVIVYTISV